MLLAYVTNFLFQDATNEGIILIIPSKAEKESSNSVFSINVILHLVGSKIP